MYYKLTSAQILSFKQVNNSAVKKHYEPFGLLLDCGFNNKEGFAEQKAWFTANQSELKKYFPLVKPIPFRIALNNAGLLGQIETIVNDPANINMKIAFEYALNFDRYDPMVSQMAVALELTESQVDDIFTSALAI